MSGGRERRTRRSRLDERIVWLINDVERELRRSQAVLSTSTSLFQEAHLVLEDARQARERARPEPDALGRIHRHLTVSLGWD